MAEGGAWAVVDGDGLAVQGRCLFLGLIFWPDKEADHVIIYDGLDATGGRLFAHFEADGDETHVWSFAHPVEFSTGIYVDGVSDDVETTIVFRQLE